MIPKGASENGEEAVYSFEARIEKQGKIVDEQGDHLLIYGVEFGDEQAPLDVMLG
ncbi:hypothetical protein COCMIDRAFT_3611 [Bipolaris oryzae ATCC 44560]|uniref:Uncharacterized protein n=1 Tax=Bipolaris oryzae ATCC 44560 TaxID=930090 RepID=W6Z6J2_COCMI|nr:uncharacterized protein COCMIDRAFT_3611 [Bipolaris oryzae ATCC 44560]EUC47352.1 hypothetical protein COCMIDRAFT_3611 [Bipolaris oryzae ATCC 44560]